MPRTPSTCRHIGLVLFDGCMPAGLFAAADMARAANLRAGVTCLRTTWVSAGGGPVVPSGGPELKPERSIADAGCDAWLVPGLWGASEVQLLRDIEALGPLVRALRVLPRAAEVWSYCTGVAIVAAAGRLGGRSATATWWLRSSLPQRFPRVQWRFDEPLVSDRGVATAAGPAGYLSLMREALARSLSPEALGDVEAVLMLARPQAWPARFRDVELISVADDRLRRLMVFAQRTEARALTLECAAAHLAMSARSLARHVQGNTGIAAGEWLRRIKLRQAGESLAATDAPVKAIVGRLGFGGEASLYRAFQRETGCTPLQFRRRYAGPRGME